jgi:hypothetical protein
MCNPVMTTDLVALEEEEDDDDDDNAKVNGLMGNPGS